MASKDNKKNLNYCWYGIIVFTIVAIVSLVVYLFQSDDIQFFEGWNDRDESMDARVSLVAIFSMIMAAVVVVSGMRKEKNYWTMIGGHDRIEDRFFGGAISVSACLTFVCFILYGQFGFEGNFADGDGEGASFIFGLACMVLAILYAYAANIIFQNKDASMNDIDTDFIQMESSERKTTRRENR
mmetsp:Transcript_19732/g.29291  ORF Transcript_19732/g.29291 Transcript_19732/m.29291 type:complete len:184 (-) Transcript_19732:1023-1574(-)